MSDTTEDIKHLEYNHYINIYLSDEYFNGDILKIAKLYQELPERVKKEFKPPIGPKRDYHRLEIRIETEYEGYIERYLTGYYWESDEELEQRKKYLKAEGEKRRKANERRLKDVEKKEKSEYLRLKEKFETKK